MFVVVVVVFFFFFCTAGAGLLSMGSKPGKFQELMIPLNVSGLSSISSLDFSGSLSAAGRREKLCDNEPIMEFLWIQKSLKTLGSRSG